jgi:hypothetical protein
MAMTYELVISSSICQRHPGRKSFGSNIEHKPDAPGPEA